MGCERAYLGGGGVVVVSKEATIHPWKRGCEGDCYVVFS